MAIVMGLLAAFSWGWADFLGGVAGRAIGVRRALFFSQGVGFGVASLLLVMLPTAREEAGTATLAGWLWGLASGAVNFAAVVSLMTGLARGKAALVAPIVATYGAITTLLELASGATIGGWALGGLGLCVLGIPLTVFSGGAPRESDASSSSAVKCALLAALLFGIGFWFQGRFALPVLGTVPTLWVLHAIDVFCLTAFLCLSPRPGQFALPPSTAWPATFGSGLMSVSGFGAMAFGALTGEIAVVAVLSTLAAGVTATLGVLLRGERLSRLQWTGVAMVLAGVLLLRAGS
jgi:drug/metabolite transporter (DMT)-like permease